MLYITLCLKVDTAMMAFFKTRKELYITSIFNVDTPIMSYLLYITFF